FRRTFVCVVALLGAALVVPAAPVGALTPNSSLFFYRFQGSPNAFRATVNNGNYSNKGSSKVAKGYSQIVADRDSLLMYNTNTGVAVTGTFRNGVFTKKHTYQLSAGIEEITAGCNSVAFFDINNGIGTIATLINGVLTQTQSVTFSGITQIAASCDTLLGYNF